MTELLQPGTHLITARHGYRHHGIYVGDGRVVHYAGLAYGLTAGPVEEITLDAFCDGHGYSVRQHKRPQYTGAQAVERARLRIGEDAYSVYRNNCEHFCEWCITGKHVSRQVNTGKYIAAGSIAAISAATTVAGRTYIKQKRAANDSSRQRPAKSAN